MEKIIELEYGLRLKTYIYQEKGHNYYEVEIVKDGDDIVAWYEKKIS